MVPWYEPVIAQVIGGRRIVLAGGVAAGWGAIAELVRRLGAADVMVVAVEGRGMGELPSCQVVTCEPPPGLTQMERIRWGNAALADLPDELSAAIEAFDPQREALVYGTFLHESPTVAGRQMLHHRRAQWLALEDKLAQDQVWEAAGIAVAPAEVVPLGEAAAAATRLDRGAGTVWAADATHGWHGGASGIEWVRDPGDASDALHALENRCQQVRVMPFLEGIPCSIHGIVCADGVVALRPVEMVTLRAGRKLRYCGCATFWDPDPSDREEMRLIARRVGAVLRRQVGFAGAFTVDGVMTSAGFRPTELNPRPGAGLATIGRNLPAGYPLILLCQLVAAGHDLGRSAAEWEAELLDSADSVRAGGTWTFEVDPQQPVAERRLSYDGAVWSADEHSGHGAVADVGPGHARCIFDAETWPVGPSVADAAVAFYAWCDQHTGTAIGPLTGAS